VFPSPKSQSQDVAPVLLSKKSTDKPDELSVKSTSGLCCFQRKFTLLSKISSQYVFGEVSQVPFDAP